MAVVTLQVTIPSGGKVQISTANTSIKFINFQNNGGTNGMRVGDSSVSSTVGHNLVKSGGEFTVVIGDIPFGYLSDWWISGTSADLCDVTYVSG